MRSAGGCWRTGLAAARAAQRSAVLLAVDCRNDYAGKVYDDLGFVETDRRAVHLYFPRRRPAAAARDNRQAVHSPRMHAEKKFENRIAPEIGEPAGRSVRSSRRRSVDVGNNSNRFGLTRRRRPIGSVPGSE